MKSNKPLPKSNTKQSSPQRFEILVDKSEHGETALKQKCYELKEMAEKIHKANERKTKENKVKDSEIDSMNDEIEKVMLNNYDLELAISKELEHRNKLEHEQFRMANYCNNWKEKFKNMQKTISEYENTVRNLNEENWRLSEAYDTKIDEIDNENKKIVKKIEDRIVWFNNQKQKIVENANIIQGLTKEIEQQKVLYEERAETNKLKYNEWEKQYSGWQKTLFELQMSCEVSKVQNVQPKAKQGVKEEKKEENVDDIIKKYEENNERLLQEINELSKQWKEMSFGSNNVAFDALNGDKSTKKSIFKSERTSVRTRSTYKN